MALSKVSLAFLAMGFLLLLQALIHVGAHAELGVQEDVSKLGRGSLMGSIGCSSACSKRCSLSSRPNMCKRACGTCCARCNCVPSGTYGNYNQCPCYGSLTTHGGRKKCP